MTTPPYRGLPTDKAARRDFYHRCSTEFLTGLRQAAWEGQALSWVGDPATDADAYLESTRPDLITIVAELNGVLHARTVARLRAEGKVAW